MPVHLLVIDDHDIYREGLKFVLGKELRRREQDVVFYEANSLESALEFCERQVDVVILDYYLPGSAELDALKIAQKLFEAPIIVHSATNDISIAQAVEVEGATFATKASANQLVDTIEAVLSGSVAEGTDREYSQWRAVIESLTNRQRQAVRLLQQGFSNKEIAQHLGIAEGTVKAHLRPVFDKLGVERRAQAIALLAKSGIEI